MILVDTSVWVSHLRYGESNLETLLNQGKVMCHSFVIGELACGNLTNRSEILFLLQSLPRVIHSTQEEAMQFIENHHLMGKGIGYLDIHLLASAVMTGVPLWTFDKKLLDVSSELGICVKTV